MPGSVGRVATDEPTSKSAGPRPKPTGDPMPKWSSHAPPQGRRPPARGRLEEEEQEQEQEDVEPPVPEDDALGAEPGEDEEPPPAEDEDGAGPAEEPEAAEAPEEEAEQEPDEQEVEEEKEPEDEEKEAELPEEDDWPLDDIGEDAEPEDELQDDFDREYDGELAPEDDSDDGADQDLEEEREAEEKDKAADEGPLREGDLSLEEVPDDMRGALEGTLELKRALSQGELTVAEERPGKRRRIDANGEAPVVVMEDPTLAKMLKGWQLERDHAAKYVLRVADRSDIEELQASRWRPDARRKRSYAEQLYEQLIRIRERRGPHCSTLDAAWAFGSRFGLQRNDCEQIAKLSHRQLHHVLTKYTEGDGGLQDLLEEASTDSLPKYELPAPERNGCFVQNRRNCLELLDPFTDALILGDANLTFALTLAEHRKSLSHVGRIVATTFEKLETLKERYPEIEETIRQLEAMQTEVLHNVDCTRLAADPRFQGMEGKFGAVYYNFPHAGVVQGYFDGHPFVRWRHANLMHLFFRALTSYVAPDGLVKVASNSKATGVRFSDIIEGARASEFAHVETFPFLEWKLSKYRRSYGDRRDAHKRPEDGEVYNDQRAHSDMVYCFVYKRTGNEMPAVTIGYPPTKDEIFLAPKEGRLMKGGGKGLSPIEARKKGVEDLYELFLTYIQGIHVG